MSASATAEANGKAASEEEPKFPVLSDALKPVLAIRDQILSEEAEIEGRIAEEKAALSVKQEERKRAEKALRLGGLIAPEEVTTSNSKDSPANLLKPHPMPDNPRSRAAIERTIKVIEEFDGEPFQISMVESQGVPRRTVEKTIGVMRGEDRMRLLGRRPQIGRDPNSPGGRTAITFQEIV